MSTDSPAASSPSSSGETSRRRLLVFLGAGGAALLASLFSRDEAQAGHDGTNVLHLGEANNAPAGSLAGTTILNANAESFALDVRNSKGGVSATSSESQPAVQGHAIAPGRAGVEGISHLSAAPEGFGQGPGTGVDGTSGTGVGVAGRSKSGLGVQGHSDTGVGGEFSTGSGKALQVDGPASIVASVAAAAGDALYVENEHPDGGGISAIAQNGHGVEGVADGPGGFGVRGIAGSDPYGEGLGVGVHGQSGTGVGVLGIATGAGVAVEARSGSLDGVALLVGGRSAFSTAGSALIPAGTDSAFVPNTAVTGDSHVSVALSSDPGSRQVGWVERSPGSGFTVHLSSASSKKRPETSLTYLIVEPA